MTDIKLFKLFGGKEPFTEWLENLNEEKTRNIIKVRLGRLRDGNFGDNCSLGGGVFELRIFNGPGYRIYFGKESDRLIILLLGGSKSNQQKDIERAKLFWRMYKYANENL
jgi:putative addiction module killer protein